jgi:hypothetical protein
MTIARHFNAGFNPQNIPSPGGTTGVFKMKSRAMVEPMRHPFSRPCGTRAGADEYPALKRRAIVGLSRWDEHGRARIPNAAGATGRVAHARGGAMTEI